MLFLFWQIIMFQVSFNCLFPILALPPFIAICNAMYPDCRCSILAKCSMIAQCPTYFFSLLGSSIVVLKHCFSFLCPYYQVIPVRRINWIFRVWLLSVLLLCTIGYVWLHADLFLLWLHGLHLLCILLDAWDGGLPCCLVLCPPHIQIHQV